MSIKKQAFADSMRIIEERLQNDKLRLAEHEAEILKKHPDITAQKKALSGTLLELSRTVLGSGENAAEQMEKIKAKNLQTQEKIVSALKEAGYPADYLSLTYECAACKDTGFVQNKKCACLLKLEAEYMAKQLCTYCRPEENRFDNFKLSYYSNDAVGAKQSPRAVMKKIYDYCAHYADTFSCQSESVLLFGGTGLGKTHLSLAIAGEVVKKGFEVVYSSAQDFLRRIEDERFGRSSGNTFDEIIGAQLVIVDDLGVEFTSDFNVSTLYDIINSRINLGRPTIINTNLSASDMEKRYSARMVSRLFSIFVCLRCEGSDVRILKAREKRSI